MNKYQVVFLDGEELIIDADSCSAGTQWLTFNVGEDYETEELFDAGQGTVGRRPITKQRLKAVCSVQLSTVRYYRPKPQETED